MRNSLVRPGLAGLLSVVLISVASTTVVVTPAAGGTPTTTLSDAVVARILAVAEPQPLDGRRVTAADTQVNVMRSAGDGWAFGSAVALAPPAPGAYPQGWLFVARRDAGRWAVAFDGDAAFPWLAAAAPSTVVPAAEKRLFASHGAPGGPVLAKAATGRAPRPLADEDYRTGMRLPYALGQSWRLTGGPHGAVRQSIDLAGGDGRVLAARAGAFYVMCGSGRGWVRVVHDRGYSTDYYHLRNNRTAAGTVAEGAFLGDIGTDVSCGGSATGPHNHFSLRQNSVNVGIAAHNFGKWQPYDGAAEYQGYALHGSTRANIGAALYNHGALGFTEAIVDTNGGGVVNRRAGPGADHAAVGTVPDGETVTIACSALGTTHTGRFEHTTNMWNRLTDGSWISDAYSWTGTANPVNGWC